MQSAVAHSTPASVTDLAYSILKSNGQAMHYRDLINEILRTKTIAGENRGRIIAQIHTEINLDSRFFHKGQGQWGLRDWVPRHAARIVQIRETEPSPRLDRLARIFGDLDVEEAGEGLTPRDAEAEESETELAIDSEESEWE